MTSKDLPTELNMESVNLYSLFFLITMCCVYSASAVSSKTKQNQIWWTKKNQPLQKGCASMCCDGRDSSCYSTGPRMGGKTAANNRCFCDEGCLDMNDCCEDYSVECQGRKYFLHEILMRKLSSSASGIIVSACEQGFVSFEIP